MPSHLIPSKLFHATLHIYTHSYCKSLICPPTTVFSCICRLWCQAKVYLLSRFILPERKVAAKIMLLFRRSIFRCTIVETTGSSDSTATVIFIIFIQQIQRLFLFLFVYVISLSLYFVVSMCYLVYMRTPYVTLTVHPIRARTVAVKVVECYVSVISLA